MLGADHNNRRTNHNNGRTDHNNRGKSIDVLMSRTRIWLSGNACKTMVAN